MSDQSYTDVIDEDTVRFFVWSVWNFFKTSTEIEPEVGAPYLFDNFEHNDFTGIIGVSGSQKGAVYFTMGRDLLNKILEINYPELGEEDYDDEALQEMCMDYSGEMANIVSGNVRNYLGERFLISVPVVVTAPKTKMRMQEGMQGIVFPIKWSDTHCHLVLCLEKNKMESDDIAIEELEKTV